MDGKNTEHLIRMAAQRIAWGESTVEVAEFLMEELNDATNAWFVYTAATLLAKDFK